ncbi:MAG: ribosome biogenesis GTPase Der [Spirochaetes bacterium]|nr:ribosome biogenesis GTPase Der [Spirochaetota bacterium]
MCKVAVLGRPNVGKSTLFNALIGRRQAITHGTPGVTRDAGEGEWRLANRRVVLVDTGGWQAGEDGIAAEVAMRSLREARDADAALLVLDALETTAEDERFMEVLRPLSDRVVLVVNKVDTVDRDPLVWNRLAHGFPSVVGVSAVHRRNLDALADTVEALLDERLPTAPGTDQTGDASEGGARGREIRVAILGRPNTGKSSLANRLIGRARSIVSAEPGTTRDVVVGSFQWRGTSFRLLDTAGLRRRTHVDGAVEYYSAARSREAVRECDLVFLVIDAVEGLSDQDKKIAALSVAEGRGLFIVLNKWDLVGRGAGLASEARERIRFQFPVLAYAPVLTVSAATGAGVARLLSTAVEVHAQLTHHAGTGRLNQALAGWVAHYRPPGRGANYRIRYLVQVSTNPVRFAAFVNRLAGFPTSYTQYLENCIRRDFGMPNVPISIELRQSRRSSR